MKENIKIARELVKVAKILVADMWSGVFDKTKVKNAEGLGIVVKDALFGTTNAGQDWAAASYDVQYEDNGGKKAITLTSKAEARKFISEYVAKKTRALNEFADEFVSILSEEAKDAAEKYVNEGDFSDDAEMLGISEKQIAQEIIKQAKQLWG